jgi:hypothetical protein
VEDYVIPCAFTCLHVLQANFSTINGNEMMKSLIYYDSLICMYVFDCVGKGKQLKKWMSTLGRNSVKNIVNV